MKSKNKRLIASMITNICMSTAIISFGFASYFTIQQNTANTSFGNSEAVQISMYDAVKQTSIFKNEYSKNFDSFSREYENNDITFDEYAKDIEYLNSNQFVIDVINTYGNDEIQSDLNTIQLQCNDMKNVSSVCKNATNISIATCGVSTGAIASAFAYDRYKMRKNQKSKENINLELKGNSLC